MFLNEIEVDSQRLFNCDRCEGFFQNWLEVARVLHIKLCFFCLAFFAMFRKGECWSGLGAQDWEQRAGKGLGTGTADPPEWTHPGQAPSHGVVESS